MKWIDWKLHEFATQENQNLRWSKERWLQRYLYTKEHRVLFSLFPYKLHEWLSNLADNKPTWKHNDPILWNPKLIKRLEESDYKVARVADYQ